MFFCYTKDITKLCLGVMMKKILVVFTGGTIACVKTENVMDTNKEMNYYLLEKYREIDRTVEFDTISPMFILSENLCAKTLVKLATAIDEIDFSQYDGVIVTHGTDTLQYSASYVSLVCKNITKPVVFVSSNYPLDDPRANGLENFCKAVEFVKNINKFGVFVCYKNKGENAKIHSPEMLLDYDCFDDNLRSAFDSFLYEYNREFIKKTEYVLPQKHYPNSLCSSSVVKQKFTPGFSFDNLSDSVKCLVLETYHSGTLKTDTDFFEKLAKKDIKVVLCGVYGGDIYKSAKGLKSNKNLIISDKAPIYTFVKCWVCIDNGIDIEF